MSKVAALHYKLITNSTALAYAFNSISNDKPLSVTDDKCPQNPQISCFPQWEHIFMQCYSTPQIRSDHRVQRCTGPPVHP